MDYLGLQNEISKGIITPLYLFVAEDSYIANSYIELIKNRILGSDELQLNQNIFKEKSFDVSELVNALNTLPIMADYRLVVAKVDNLSDSKLSEAITGYISAYSQTTIFILYTNEVDKRSKLYKSFNKSGKVVYFNKLKYKEVDKWVVNRLKKSDITIDNDALNYFITNTDFSARDSGIDLGYLVNEVDKLVMYNLKRKKIDLPTVKKVIVSNINNNIFEYIDSMLNADTTTAFQQLYYMKENNINFSRIISTVTTTIKNMTLITELYQDGVMKADIIKQLSVSPYVVEKAIAFTNKLSIKKYTRILKTLYNSDLSIKKGELDVDTSLELMTSKICDISKIWHEMKNNCKNIYLIVNNVI